MKNSLLVVGAIFLLSACSSSKFDYNTAYKFKYQQNKRQESSFLDIQKPAPVTLAPMASLKPIFPITASLPADVQLKQLTDSKNAKATVFEHYKNASKSEKRAIRKQVKQEYKLLKKEVKEARDQATKDIVFNKKMYIGAVILAAGILVAILASGGVGAVGIIVGIGLMAWGLIEQA